MGTIIRTSGGYYSCQCTRRGPLSPDIWQKIAEREVVSIASWIVAFLRLLL
jgi:hypothetical protein